MTSENTSSILALEGCDIDLVTGVVRHHTGVVQRLSERERSLLTHLAMRPNHVYDRAGLLRDVWGYVDSVHSRAVDMSLVRLRRKVETQPNRPRHIRTEHGRGVWFSPLPTDSVVGPIVALSDGTVDLATGAVVRQLVSYRLDVAALGALRDLIAADGPVSARALAERHGSSARSLLKQLRAAVELDPVVPRHIVGLRGRGVLFRHADSGASLLKVGNVSRTSFGSPCTFTAGLHRLTCSPTQLARQLRQQLDAGEADEAWLFVAHGQNAAATVIQGAVLHCGFAGKHLVSLRQAWSGRRVVVGLVCDSVNGENLGELTTNNVELSVLVAPRLKRPNGSLGALADAAGVFASPFDCQQARRVCGLSTEDVEQLAEAGALLKREHRWEIVCAVKTADSTVNGRYRAWVERCAADAWRRYERSADSEARATLVEVGLDLERALAMSVADGVPCTSLGRSLSTSLVMRGMNDARVERLQHYFVEPYPDVILAEMAHACWRARRTDEAERYARRVLASPDAHARGVGRLMLGHAMQTEGPGGVDQAPLALSVAEDTGMPPYLRGWAWIEFGNAVAGAGQVEQAEHAYCRAKAIWSRAGNARWLSYVASRRAHVALFQADDVEEAVRLHMRSVTESRRTGSVYNEAIAYGFAAPAFLALGEVSYAESMARDGLILARQCDDVAPMGLALFSLGNIMIALGEFGRAIDFADRLGQLPGLRNKGRAAGLVRASAHWWSGDWVATASVLRLTFERNERQKQPFHTALLGGQVVCAAEHIGATNLANAIWPRVVAMVDDRPTEAAVAVVDRMRCLRAALRGESRPVETEASEHPAVMRGLEDRIARVRAGTWPNR